MAGEVVHVPGVVVGTSHMILDLFEAGFPSLVVASVSQTILEMGDRFFPGVPLPLSSPDQEEVVVVFQPAVVLDFAHFDVVREDFHVILPDVVVSPSHLSVVDFLGTMVS